MSDREAQDAEDRADLDRCRAGDPAAFERLYRRHAPVLYGLALLMVRRADVAEDVLQDAFLTLHRRADTFRGESRVGTWLAAVALNGCRMRLRSERRPTLPLDHAALVPAREPQEGGEALERALARLDPDVRELLLLAAAGNSYEEIGTILDLSAGQVRGRLHRARQALLALLGAED